MRLAAGVGTRVLDGGTLFRTEIKRFCKQPEGTAIGHFAFAAFDGADGIDAERRLFCEVALRDAGPHAELS